MGVISPMLSYGMLVDTILVARTQEEIRTAGVQSEGSFSFLDENQRRTVGEMLWALVVNSHGLDDESVWPAVRMAAIQIPAEELPGILDFLHSRRLDICLQAALQIVARRVQSTLPDEVLTRLEELLPTILGDVFSRPISTTRDVLCLCAFDVIVGLGLPYWEWETRLKKGRSQNFGWGLDHHIRDNLKA